jgi:colanic acid/amylovoran biosynthesis glycosyltransferase
LLCLIGFDDNKVIKDFIRIHVEGLRGDKVLLSGSYPDFQWNGLNIRKLHEQPAWKRRVCSLLPYAVNSRRLNKLGNCRLNAQRAVGSFLTAQNVDVVLAEFGNIGCAVAPVAAETRIPLVVHFHGHDAHREPFLTKAIRSQYEFMFNSAAAILVVSRYMWQTVADMGCPVHKLIYNPYGPRDKFFDVQPDYSPVVLSVGRFTDIKANYLVLMAFQQALQRVPHAKLVMAGDGELLETCRTLAQVWRIEQSVEFPGPVEHSRVHQLFAHACCFAQHSLTPSYGDAEGTPNTVLEASAAALPVVATRHAGIPDVVIHGETGLLSDERDVAGMADHLVLILTNPDTAKCLGSNARSRIQQHLTSAAHIARLQAAIDFACNGNSDAIATLAAESILAGQTA